VAFFECVKHTCGKTLYAVTSFTDDDYLPWRFELEAHIIEACPEENTIGEPLNVSKFVVLGAHNAAERIEVNRVSNTKYLLPLYAIGQSRDE